jgi:3-dehydroquinate dehydratase
MSLTMVLILVVTFSVVINGLLRRFVRQLPLISGVEYLLLGLALGPRGADLLSEQVIETLRPVISLTMGLAGFTMGLPLRHSVRYASTVQAGFVTAVLTAASVAGASYLALRRIILPAAPTDALWLAIALGAAAATISAPLIERGISHLGARGPVTEMIKSHAVAGNIVGVATAGVALAVARAHQTADHLALTETEWLVVSGGLGVACGILFSIFLGRAADAPKDRTFLATVGVVILTSGVAASMNVSPLLLNAIAGVVTSFLYPYADRLHSRLRALEAPAFTMLLIFAGALWSPPPALGWLLALTYLIVRVAGLRVAAAVAVRVVPEVPRPANLGGGLVAQGAMTAAIVMNFSQVNATLASLAMTAVLPALALSAPVSPRGLRAMLADAGELGRVGDGPGEGTHADGAEA